MGPNRLQIIRTLMVRKRGIFKSPRGDDAGRGSRGWNARFVVEAARGAKAIVKELTKLFRAREWISATDTPWFP